MKQKIENFIYAHSSPNGCVALTRVERDELFEMLDEFQEQIKLIESVTDANADMIEKMKCCGNCKHFLENGYEYNDCDQYRWWDKCDKWELEK